MACSLTSEPLSYWDVLPLQPACPHEHAMSGFISNASHRGLQYLPDVGTHEQAVFAQLSAFALSICFLLTLGSTAGDPLMAS
jgi:hypothetical protein